MWSRLKKAAEDGIVLAVKWFIVVTMLTLLGYTVVQDYLVTRSMRHYHQLQQPPPE